MIKIYEWEKIGEKVRQRILGRAGLDIEKVRPGVVRWLKRMEREGDKALLAYIREFDDPKFKLARLRVKPVEIRKAYRQVKPVVLRAMRRQIKLSRAFVGRQKAETFELLPAYEGVWTGARVTPIKEVGLYVPAGLAPLPTVMQILGVTAKAAGCERIVACFPPRGREAELLVAADMVGVDEIYRVGGIAAIGAMAYGTKTVRSVSKIVGPGNVYVQAAKKEVFGKVGIDMLAGPSEAVILADSLARADFIAADVLARAEHDPRAAGVLITDSRELAEATWEEIKRQFAKLPRQEIMRESLGKYSALIVVKNMREAVALTNQYAPEHLEVMVTDPWAILPEITEAGSIFLGQYAPVAVGDYASGTNHVLPTGLGPRMFSAVSVETFMKKSEVQYLTAAGLKGLEPIVTGIGRVEGLEAHVQSVKIRQTGGLGLVDETVSGLSARINS